MRRERRQLLLALPVIVLAAVLGALLVLLWVWSLTAARAYDDGDLAGAGASWDRQRSLTPLWPEPWKAPYNQGTGRLAGDEYVDAVEPLRTALARVPAATPDEEGRLDPASPECRVRTNLAAALDGVAATASDAATAEAARADAGETRAPCVPPGEQEPPPTEEPTPPPGEEPEPSEPPSPTGTPGDPRLEELQERNDRAREEAEQELRDEGGGFGGGQNW